MVTPIILLNIVNAIRARTLLRKFPNRRKTSCFLVFLIALLAS